MSPRRKKKRLLRLAIVTCVGFPLYSTVLVRRGETSAQACVSCAPVLGWALLQTPNSLGSRVSWPPLAWSPNQVSRGVPSRALFGVFIHVASEERGPSYLPARPRPKPQGHVVNGRVCNVCCKEREFDVDLFSRDTAASMPRVDLMASWPVCLSSTLSGGSDHTTRDEVAFQACNPLTHGQLFRLVHNRR